MGGGGCGCVLVSDVGVAKELVVLKVLVTVVLVELMIPVMDVWVRYGGDRNSWAETADTVGDEEVDEAESAAAPRLEFLSEVFNTWVCVDLVRRGTEGVLVEVVE